MNANDYPLWTALVTPFLKNSQVDYESLTHLLKLQEEANCGVLILGSTGEALNIPWDERKKIVNYALSLKLKVPIMIGVGGILLESMQEEIDYWNTLEGVHAYLLVTPLYAKPMEHGQYEWFQKLLDTSKHPCMLYNVPSRAGTSLNFSAVTRLKNHPQFWAIKEASGSCEDFSKYVKAVEGTSIKVYSGDDICYHDYLPLKCSGLVSVASNVWPKETLNYVNLGLNQKLLKEDSSIFSQASQSLFESSNPIPVKRLLFELKTISTPLMRPPLSDKDLSSCEKQLQAHKDILAWNENLNAGGSR